MEDLALYGGKPVRENPFPARGSFGPEEKNAVNALFDKAIESGGTIEYGGPEEEGYCREFSEYLGGGYADAVSSGTTALYVALRALNPEPFTEIIVCPITDPGGLMPVPLNNCIPVIADAAPGRFNADAEQIEKMITPLTSAIIVAHIGGEPTDIDNIMILAKKHGIPVIEDCAQSHHAKLNGQITGVFGDISAFSTMFGKHHCTGGQGGVVFTKNEDMYWKIRRASDRGKPFGMPEGSNNCMASLNMNSSELACCIGRVQLKKLPGFVESRQKVAAGVTGLINDLKSVTAPEQLPGAENSLWWWRLRFNADAVKCDKAVYCDALRAEGMSVNTNYNALPHMMDWYKFKRVFGKSCYPWSAPEYKGDRNAVFPCPNAVQAVKDHFIVTINESFTQNDIDDFARIFKKVERAFVK